MNCFWHCCKNAPQPQIKKTPTCHTNNIQHPAHSSFHNHLATLIPTLTSAHIQLHFHDHVHVIIACIISLQLQQLPVEEKALEWQAELEKQLDEQARADASSTSTTSSSTSTSTSTTSTTTTSTPSSPSSTAPAAATTTASTTTSSSTQQPTTTIGNYKLAHEKSAYLKKHHKLKNLYQLHMEKEKKQLAERLRMEEKALQERDLLQASWTTGRDDIRHKNKTFNRKLTLRLAQNVVNNY